MMKVNVHYHCKCCSKLRVEDYLGSENPDQKMHDVFND